MNPIEFFVKSAKSLRGFSDNCTDNYIGTYICVTVSGKSYVIENIGLNNTINRKISFRFVGGTAVTLKYDENLNFEFATDFDAEKAREWVFKDEKLTANDIVRMAVVGVQFELQLFRANISSLIESEVEI